MIRMGEDQKGALEQPTEFERDQAARIVREWVALGLTCMPANKDDLQMMRSDIAAALATNRAVAGETGND